MKFPEIDGNNLEEQPYHLPYDLEGELNLLIVPFKRWQQSLVDQWSVFLNEIASRYNFFKFYEIPTLAKSYKLMRFMIDGGMRAGIPNKEVRMRTITVYINKTPFKKKLEIRDENNIYLFLVNKSGEILWRAEGGFSQDLAEDLAETLNSHLNSLNDI